MLNQLVAIVGAVIVLAAFAGLQTGRLERQDRSFNALNFVGSVLLAWVAIADRLWGFIALESIWALFSLLPLVRRPQPRPRS